ncbi:MAG TPA: ankyrin repeat domain-containing protein [Rhodocyclaceae bacterium]|nr:ankyrin repeat domain-containing protein [Rhodocyclaceae bacterium]
MKTKLYSLLLGLTLSSASATVFAGAYDDLIGAAYLDDTRTVMGLVNRGMDVNSVDPAGNSLLHIAARSGNDGLIAELLKQKANPNIRNRVGDTPLMLAAYMGKQAAVDALLAGGAQINLDGWTPLQYAVFADQPEMVAHLLAKGAKVDARAPNQQTALMLAAKSGNASVARLLLNAKADVELTDQSGETALTLAQKNNNSDIVRLIEHPEAAAKAAPPPATAAPKAAPETAPVPVKAPVPQAVEDDVRGEYVPPMFQTEK